jgi:tetratricopeptide (TPR) repeat protein
MRFEADPRVKHLTCQTGFECYELKGRDRPLAIRQLSAVICLLLVARSMACLFISHSSLNNDRAVAVRDWLAENGWTDVFLDLDPKSGLAPGELWRHALAAAADRCEAVLFLISPQWIASSWCFNEFLLAKQLGKPIFPVIVADIDLSALPSEITADHQAVDLIRDPYGWERLKHGLNRAGLDPETFPFSPGRRPFPGFEPLTEQDAAIFFGRDAQIVRGLDRLRTMSEVKAERMLVILGASGAGKSSYLRAGLWPRLKRDDRNFVLLPVIRPDRAALTGRFGLFVALESALAETRVDSESVRGLPRSRAGISDLVNGSPAGFFRLLASLRAARVAALVNDIGKLPTIVIPVDQGEELFNEEGKQEASRFMELIAAASTQDLGVMIIVAMRSDSFPHLQNEPRLVTVRKAVLDLPALPVGSMRVVIEGPARVAKPPVKLDPDLVDALLEDSSGPDSLPLLAFTLGRMLQSYGAEGKLTLTQYDRLGRLSGAVNAAVSEVLEQGMRLGGLPRDTAALDSLLRETFIPHLARVNKADQFVRRIALRTELPARSLAAVDLLVEARLLVRDRRSSGDADADVIEVAHEALLREWPALRGWLEADRQFLIGKDQLAEDIANWSNASSGQKDDALLSGLNLTRARQWLIERQPQDFNSEEREFIAASIARAEAASRRKRRLGLAAACLLLVITGAAVWESIQAGKARSIAESRLSLARRSAEDLVKLIATDLRSVQGIQIQTLERLLQTTKRSFDELSSAVGNDPKFSQYRAQMMSEFGETYLKAKGLDQASSAYEESLQIYRSLAAKDPDAVTWRRGIADQIEQVGVVRQQQGRIEPAMDNFRRALDIRYLLAEREPSSAVSHRDLASSHYRIGEIQMQRRMASDSLTSHNRALEEQQRALDLDPSNLDLQSKLSKIHVSIGVAHEALGQRERRLGSYLTALAIRKRLVETNPDNSEWKRMLAWAYFWIGGHYLNEGNLDEALKNYRPCLAWRLSLTKSNPADLVAKYDLAWAYHDLGIVFLQKRDVAAAEANYNDAFSLRRDLVELDPNNARWRKDLALSHETLGDLASARNDSVAALKQYSLAAGIMEELISAAPTNAGWRDSLAVIYDKVAVIERCQGAMDAAFLNHEKALLIRNVLLDENPNDFGTILRAARSELLVGEALELRAELELTLAHYRRALELAMRMRAIRGDDPMVGDLLRTVQERIDLSGVGDPSDRAVRPCGASIALQDLSSALR